MLTANVSSGRLRALEAETPLAERSSEDLAGLIRDEVIQPEVVETWTLFESIVNKTEIEAEVAAMPGTELVFKSWINWNFLTSPQSSDPLNFGIAVAILGSIWVNVIAFLVAVPMGTAAAIYLEEYSTGKSRMDQIIETNINNLAGVPSIIYGMLGLAVFVRLLAPITSGQVFGYGSEATANGRTILSAGLTLGVLILPLVIINAREAIRAVPRSLREASYGLGATRWQTVWNHVLPNAISGILTGCDSIRLPRVWRDRTTDRGRRFDVHRRQANQPILKIHNPAGASLPVDIPSTRGISTPGCGSHYRSVSAVDCAQRHRDLPAESILTKKVLAAGASET